MTSSYYPSPANLSKETFDTLIQQGAKIIDVRTIHEYTGTHLEGSYNIPSEEILHFIGDLNRWNKPFIIVSADGYRSKEIVDTLQKWYIEAYDGGAWESYL